MLSHRTMLFWSAQQARSFRFLLSYLVSEHAALCPIFQGHYSAIQEAKDVSPTKVHRAQRTTREYTEIHNPATLSTPRVKPLLTSSRTPLVSTHPERVLHKLPVVCPRYLLSIDTSKPCVISLQVLDPKLALVCAACCLIACISTTDFLNVKGLCRTPDNVRENAALRYESL